MEFLNGHFATIRRLSGGAWLAFLLLGVPALYGQYTAFDSLTNTFTVAEGSDVSRDLTLPEGADLLRVTGDWTSVSGSAFSSEFQVSVVGPDGQTGAIEWFDNAAENTSGVTDLTGEVVLSSQGTAGVYTFTFSTTKASSSAQIANIEIDAELILDSFSNAGALDPTDPTFDRPAEDFTSDGVGTNRYETYDFTPAFSGSYVIDSTQTGDGFILLYSAFNDSSPTSNSVAADDDARGLGDGFSKLSASLTAGTTYTLVTTSFENNVSLSYTNEIRYSVRLDQIPNTWVAFQQLNNLTSFTSDKDNDGISDGFEYAFDSDPDVADNISDFQVLSYDSGTDRLSLTFTRDDTKTDIEYIVEGNSSLDSNSWVSLATLTDSTPNNAPGSDTTKHVVEDSTTITSAGQRFLRLRVRYTGP